MRGYCTSRMVFELRIQDTLLLFSGRNSHPTAQKGVPRPSAFFASSKPDWTLRSAFTAYPLGWAREGTLRCLLFSISSSNICTTPALTARSLALVSAQLHTSQRPVGLSVRRTGWGGAGNSAGWRRRSHRRWGRAVFAGGSQPAGVSWQNRRLTGLL